MKRIGIMLAIVGSAGLFALIGGCERRVVSETYRPSTGLGGDYQYQPMPRSQPQIDRNWWDDLFGGQDALPQGGSQPTETRTFKPVWDKYGNAAQQPATTPSQPQN